MKIEDLYIRQKVGLSHRGEVITGKVVKVFEDVIDGKPFTIATVETPQYELLEVNIKKLLGIVK